jgi:hypothetical protein
VWRQLPDTRLQQAMPGLLRLSLIHLLRTGDPGHMRGCMRSLDGLWQITTMLIVYGETSVDMYFYFATAPHQRG